MLENFQIRDFRCLSDFSISGLRRINLIAGKNGVGKSALLEAIRLYRQPDLDSILEILDWRDEVRAASSFWTPGTIAPLFYLGTGKPPATRFILRGNRGTLVVEVSGLRKSEVEVLIEGQAGLGPPRDPNVILSLRLKTEDPDQTPYVTFPLDGSIKLNSQRARIARESLEFLGHAKALDYPGVYLRSDPVDSDWLSKNFEAISGTDQEVEVNRIASWIIPDAERLLTKGDGDERMIFVKRRGMPGPEPLRRFGDGAVRLTALALALVNSRGGCCLIDEIENGIHYELFDQIWEKLSLLSQALNVQIFATTHSKDCLEAFERSYRHSHFDACYYRFEREGDRTVAVRLDNESYFSVVAGREHEIR